MSQQQPSLLQQVEVLDRADRVGRRHRRQAVEQRRPVEIDVTPIGVIHRRTREISAAGRAFLALLTSELGSLTAPKRR